MYLKSIEVHGFKSFANRIKFEFHNGITAIVGPNGSGKSNVADAVRWVLGEQRIKQLRGSSMQDVIFSGTELRKPLGYAYVAITLDNSDHALNIDYNEVTVSRRLYRSGESEYMINGNVCRLKDVNELFYDTGIGKEGYSIIGQGQIDQILSSKPEDRRNLFDEAAGITKFKLRKDQTIKKLEDEKVNLTRVSDILAELEKQLGPLEKQAEVAKVYLRDRERLKTLDVNIFLLDNERLRNALKDAREKYAIAEHQLAGAREDYEKTKVEYEQIEQNLETLDREIEEARNQMTQSSVQKEKLEGQIGILQEQIRAAEGNGEHFENRRAALEEEIRSRSTEAEKFDSEKQEVDDLVGGLEEAKRAAAGELEALQNRISELSERIDENQKTIIASLNDRAQIKSRLSSLDTRKEQIQIRKAELTSRLVAAESDESRQEETIRQLRETFEAVTREIETLQEQQKAQDQELAGIHDRLNEQDQRFRGAESRYHQEKSRMDALANITERYEGYGGSVRRVMEQKDRVPGICGVVADLLKTDARYETAMETALGGSIQNIVTEDEATAKRMIAFLKENKAGRATFLPLDAMRNPGEFKLREALREPGVIGLADELVKTEDKFRGVAKALLGRILVVDQVDHATQIARKYHYSIRIVTLEGELLVPGGAISGGAFKNSSNLLGRRREMDTLEANVKKYAADMADAQEQIQQIRARRNELRTKVEELRMVLQGKILEQNTARINVETEENRRKEAQGSFSNLKEENDSIESRMQEIEDQKQEADAALEASLKQEQTCQEENASLSAQIETLTEEEKEKSAALAAQEIEITKIRQKQEFASSNVQRVQSEIDEKRADLQEVLDNIASNKEEAQTRRSQLEEVRRTIEASVSVQSDSRKALEEKQMQKEALTARQKTFFTHREQLSESIASLDKEVTRLEAQKEKYEESMESQINYMWDEYEITLSDAEGMKDESLTDAHEMKKEISSLKDAIRKLGDVNVNAIEDFKNLTERYSFMKTQHDDLIKAENQLREIITELDTAMRTQFSEQFHKINAAFDRVFSEMFGGGKGSLELVEDEDILEAGIRIIAQPPGKKLVNMMQMSGGEKALTAIALLFAIQDLRPSPFCLLDEIEAALDENNVVRFARYLHKLENTQFIVITHRRGTMESADRLYGITMQEKGVSALVSVNLIDKELTN